MRATFVAGRPGAATLIIARIEGTVVASIPLSVREGVNRVYVSGFVRGRPLHRGRYRLVVRTAGAQSSSTEAAFRVVASRRARRR
jgi:hypothetical protein